MTFPRPYDSAASDSCCEESSRDSRPLGSPSTPRIDRATRAQGDHPPVVDSPVFQTALPTENKLVSLPWLSLTTIYLADLVEFARERQETYFARLHSSSFLSFVEMAQVLLTYAKTPKSAQHIKSSSSCSVICLIGEHGAGKTTLAKAAVEFVFRYLPKVHSHRRGKEGGRTDADERYPEPWDICPSFIQVQSATAAKKDLYHDVNNGFACTGPVVLKHMRSPSATVGLAGPEAIVLLDDAHDPLPWIFGSNAAVIMGLSDGTRCIEPTSSTVPDANQVPDTISQRSSLPQRTQDIPAQQCRVSVTKAKRGMGPDVRSNMTSLLTYDIGKPCDGFLYSQTSTPPTRRYQEPRIDQGPIVKQRDPEASRHATALCDQPLQTASSMLLCLGNVPVPRKGDSAHEIKAGFVDANQKNLLHMAAQHRVHPDATSASVDDVEWASGALSFWKAAAELRLRRLRPMVVKSAPVHLPTQALYTAICRLSARDMARLMEMSSTPPVSATQAEQRLKDPLKYGLPPAELQNLFAAGLTSLDQCRGFSQASYAGPYDAWVTRLKSAIEKRKASQSNTVTEDVLQRIRPAHVLWLPAPSSSSNALRDELAAFVDKACMSGDIAFNVLEGLDCAVEGEHPYPFASLLSPYNVDALVSDSGDMIFSVNGEDASVWSWATKTRRLKALRVILHTMQEAGKVDDTRVDAFIEHLLATSLPTQSPVQNAAAWIIASRFITYKACGTILSERGVVGRKSEFVSETDRLACILMHLRAVCSHNTNQEFSGTSKLWADAVALAETLADLEDSARHLNYAFNMFNGLVCATARSFVSIALDHVHLGQHSAKLAQVVPDDAGRLVANILTARRDVGTRNCHGVSKYNLPIDPALALDALSLAKGQGSVRELRNTMRSAAKTYASSLYAERVAAGVEWMAFAIAGRLFRIAFTSPEDDSSLSATALHGCREFVANSDGLPRRGVILPSLLRALSDSSLSFVRQSANSRQVFAIVSQTAETCDLVTALTNAGAHCPTTDMAIGSGEAGRRSPSLSQELPPLGTQPRDEIGSPRNSLSASPVAKEKMTRLSEIRCHSIWTVLHAGNSPGTRKKRGARPDNMDEDGGPSRGGCSSSTSSDSSNGSSSSDKIGSGDGEAETGAASFSILVCTANSKLTKVGTAPGDSATFLCGVCVRSRTQAALAAWLSSWKQWKQEVEALSSSVHVRRIINDALTRMKDRHGSTTVGRVKQRQDIQNYFNNYPQVCKARVPARARVVYDIADQCFRIDMKQSRLFRQDSFDLYSELVVPRANEVVAEFLQPACGDKEKGILLRDGAEVLAKSYVGHLVTADAPLSRKDHRLLHDTMVHLCTRRSSDRRAILCLNTIYRISPVLGGMRGRGHAATNLLAAALAADNGDEHGTGHEPNSVAAGNDYGREHEPIGTVGGTIRTVGGSRRADGGGSSQQRKTTKVESKRRAVTGIPDRYIRSFGGSFHQRRGEEAESGRRSMTGAGDRYVCRYRDSSHQRNFDEAEFKRRAVKGVADRYVSGQKLGANYRAAVVGDVVDVEYAEGMVEVQDAEDMAEVEGMADVDDVEDEPADEMSGDDLELQMGRTQPDTTPVTRPDTTLTSNVPDLAELWRSNPEVRSQMEALVKHGATPTGIAASIRRPYHPEAEKPSKRRKSREDGDAQVLHEE
jgi:hypothetical protein